MLLEANDEMYDRLLAHKNYNAFADAMHKHLQEVGGVGTEMRKFQELCDALTRYCKEVGVESDGFGLHHLYWQWVCKVLSHIDGPSYHSLIKQVYDARYHTLLSSYDARYHTLLSSIFAFCEQEILSIVGGRAELDCTDYESFERLLNQYISRRVTPAQVR